MKPSSFEHIVRIQFNALMMTVIKCTVKSRNRQFVRRSKREILFCELSDTKLSERGTIDNYSCDCISFKVLNYTIQVSNEKFAVALYKLSSKERDVILLRYFQSMSDQEIAELYHCFFCILLPRNLFSDFVARIMTSIIIYQFA